MIPQLQVLLSMQRALLGAVSPNLRAVVVEQSDSVAYLRFYYRVEPTEKEWDMATVAGTEFGADFPDLFLEETKIVGSQPVASPPGSQVVFLREGVTAVAGELVQEPVKTERARCAAIVHQLLLGKITENLESVSVVWTESKLVVECWFSEAPSNDELAKVAQIESALVRLLAGYQVEMVTRVGQSRRSQPYRDERWLVFERY